MPGLSYSTPEKDADGKTVVKRHNAIEGLGEGFKAAAKEFNKFAMPVHSKKNEIIENMQKSSTSRGRF